MSIEMTEEIKRWTAKRKSALVIALKVYNTPVVSLLTGFYSITLSAHIRR